MFLINYPVNTHGIAAILEPYREIREMYPTSYRYNNNNDTNLYSYTQYPRESVSQQMQYPFGCSQPRFTPQSYSYQDRNVPTASSNYPPPLSHPARETIPLHRNFSSCQREPVPRRTWSGPPTTISMSSPQLREITEISRGSYQHLVSASSTKGENNAHRGRYTHSLCSLLE